MHQFFESLVGGGNQFLSGGLVLMVLGAIAAYARGLPSAIWRHLERTFCIIIDIREEDLLKWTCRWMSLQNYGENCRRLLAEAVHDDDRLEFHSSAWPRVIFSPGIGFHFFFYKGRPFIVHRNINDEVKQGDNFAPLQTLEIIMLGRSRSVVEALFDEIREVNRRLATGQRIALADAYGRWRFSERSAPRAIDSVVLPNEMASNILGDLSKFLSSEDEYRRLNIPYRIGFMFHGPPGNGKSSIVAALCSHFSLPLYVAHLREKSLSDGGFAGLVAELPHRAALLIEDADCMIATRDGKDETESVDKSALTLSGVLNAIDGPVATEGRVLFITTNRPQKLDEAMLRPGRIDRIYEFAPPTVEQAHKLHKRFFPNCSDAEREKFIGSLNGEMKSMAALQDVLIRKAF